MSTQHTHPSTHTHTHNIHFCQIHRFRFSWSVHLLVRSVPHPTGKPDAFAKMFNHVLKLAARNVMQKGVRFGSHGGIPGEVSRALEGASNKQRRRLHNSTLLTPHRSLFSWCSPVYLCWNVLIFVLCVFVCSVLCCQIELAVPDRQQVQADGHLHRVLWIGHRCSVPDRPPPAVEGISAWRRR